jgi:hypothetical protein
MTMTKGRAVLPMMLCLLAACGQGDAPQSTTDTTSPPEATTREPFEGDEFYAVPDPLPEGEPGVLVRYEPIEDHGLSAAAWRIMYLSEAIDGTPIAVTGSAVIPSASPDEGGRPILSFAHGSTGVADDCAFSPPSQTIGDFRTYVEAGYIVVLTDYEGLGTPGRHPILVGESEGRSVLDAARAARLLPEAHAGNEVAISGLSQGGHAALWAGQLAQEWAPELDVIGVVPGEPVTGLDRLFDTHRSPESVFTGVTVQVVAGYAAAYANFESSLVLTRGGEERLDIVDETCFEGVVQHFAGDDRDDIIQPPGSVPEWTRLLVENNPGQVHTDIPVLLLHSAADSIISPDVIDDLFARMCGLDQIVERRTYDVGDHSENDARAIADSFEWFEKLRAGEDPVTNCAS